MYAILDENTGESMKKHGGARAGAGRPKGQGKYKEATKPIRIPLSMVSKVQQLIDKENLLPLFLESVQAGFPTTISDNSFEEVDLNSMIIKHPTATFLLRASGDSMTGAGIFSNDILIVDRSIEPKNNKIVIVAIDGQLTVKRLRLNKNSLTLIAENPNYENIEVQQHEEIKIWGVVTMVLHAL